MSDLPVPRLEFEWRKSKRPGWDWTCFYWLVIPSMGKGDMRDPKGKGWVRKEMGKTFRGGVSEPVYNGVVDTPFRDYAHMRCDALSLKLPAYARYLNYVTMIEFKPDK